jgi:hypothetical protein
MCGISHIISVSSFDVFHFVLDAVQSIEVEDGKKEGAAFLENG